MLKDKEKILKAMRKLFITYIKPCNINFASETMKPKRRWDNIFKMLKEKNCLLRIISSKTVFQKYTPDKQNWENLLLAEYLTRNTRTFLGLKASKSRWKFKYTHTHTRKQSTLVKAVNYKTQYKCIFPLM